MNLSLRSSEELGLPIVRRVNKRHLFHLVTHFRTEGLLKLLKLLKLRRREGQRMI